MAWNAWRELKQRQHLLFGLGPLTRPSRPVIQGVLTDNVVVIEQTLTRRERHTALTHELVHDERQIFPVDRVLVAREELAVKRITADRVCPLNELDQFIGETEPDISELLEHFDWCDLASLTLQLSRLAEWRRSKNGKGNAEPST